MFHLFTVTSMWALIFLAALCVGSFIGLIIYRLPIILSHTWQREAHHCLGMSTSDQPRFHLLLPRSRCDHCQTKLKKRDLIPIVSFFILKGRCRFCHYQLSWQMPFTELLSAVLLTLIFWYAGFSAVGFVAAVTLFYCLCLAFIDYNTQLLPDCLTLSWLWLGLLWHLQSNPSASILGAAVGYVLPWLVNALFTRIRRQPGMGQGDFKCLAAIGAWGGLSAVLGAYFLGALLCLLISVPYLLKNKSNLQKILPFGPFLCLVGWFMINFPALGDLFIRWVRMPT